MAQYGLIGEKLVHSFSKILHNRMNNPEYDLMEISRDDIEEYLKKADFSGINVTIPTLSPPLSVRMSSAV